MQEKKLKLKDNLNYLLDQQKSSMSTVAKKAGVNKSTLHSYIEGVTPKAIVTVESLAHFFGVDPSELLYSDLKQGKARKKPSSGHEHRFEITIRAVDGEHIIDVLQQKP